MSRSVSLVKGKNNMIGISIGGGAPVCPVLYVVQVFHRTPAYDEGSLCPGDELTTVNGVTLRGLSRKQTADIIQGEKGKITITFNRLEPPSGKGMDISIKKVKHRLVDKMNGNTADSLGLSRAVLVNDKLINKVNNLEKNAKVYRGIAERSRIFLVGIKMLAESHRDFGQMFSNIGVYEVQKSASVAFTNFGTAHVSMADEGVKLIKSVGPMLRELYTFLEKAVPDTKLTIKKYSDAKFEFLAYCLKVKEMDDEEFEAASYCQLLNRVLLGNYEYRMFLRCRHAAKLRFIRLRSDVLVKLQLLDNKRVQDVAFQLERVVAGMYIYYRQSYRTLKPSAIFPIEVELDIVNLQGKGLLESQSVSSTSAIITKEQGITEGDGRMIEETESSDTLPPMDDLLLDMGLESQGQGIIGSEEQTIGGTEDSNTLPPVDNLLLDLGLH